jgi:hypothetical protein
VRAIAATPDAIFFLDADGGTWLDGQVLDIAASAIALPQHRPSLPPVAATYAVAVDNVVTVVGPHGPSAPVVVGAVGGVDHQSVGPDGTAWFQIEHGDSHAVGRILPGEASYDEPFDSESMAPAVSPDGTTLAFVRQGITVEETSFVFVDLATMEVVRELPWERTGSIDALDWSPDGSQLLVTEHFDGADTVLLDVDAPSFDEARPAWNGPVGEAVFVDDQRIAVLDFQFHVVRIVDLTTGEESELDIAGVPVDISAGRDGLLAVLTEDTLVSVNPDGTVATMPLESPITAIGF